MIPDNEIPDGDASDNEIPDRESQDGEIPGGDASDGDAAVGDTPDGDAVTGQTQSFPGAFCEPCNKWREPNALLADGTCPRCGTQLDENAPAASDAASAKAQAAAKIPWHFWVMVAATAIYLGWRVIQGLQALF